MLSIIFAERSTSPQELLDQPHDDGPGPRLRHVGLEVKPSKCVPFKPEIQYLGHLVSVAGINPMPEKVDAVRDFPVPQCVRDVQAFVGRRHTQRTQRCRTWKWRFMLTLGSPSASQSSWKLETTLAVYIRVGSQKLYLCTPRHLLPELLCVVL